MWRYLTFNNARPRGGFAFPAGLLAMALLGAGCPLEFVSSLDGGGGVNEPESPEPEFRPEPEGDGGVPPDDAGDVDAGDVDAGPDPEPEDVDSGNADGGLTDAGGTDAGVADGGGVELPRCGDLLVQPSNQETCDDGNLVDGDGCSAACTLERTCLGEASVAVTSLEIEHNVVLRTGTLDDATTAIGVAFDLPTPQNDAFPWTVSADLDGPSTVMAVRLGTPGGVDNGGIGSFSLRFVTTDGITVGSAGPFVPATATGAAETFAVSPSFAVSRIDLVIESGLDSGVAFHALEPVAADRCCGDGIVDVAEACEDGNNVDTDGCSSQCEIETGFSCDEAKAVNLVHNGGFGGGLVGFTTEIPQVPGPLDPGNCGDQRQLLMQSTVHDTDGDGFFLATEGLVVDGAIVWSQALELEPGAYALSVTLSDRTPEDATRPSLEVFWGDQSQGVLDANDESPTQTITVDVPVSASAELSLRNREAACPGNDVALDGISLVRSDFDGSRCSSCGDGLKLADEACDDGNQDDEDGCSAICAREASDVFCPVPGLGCISLGPEGPPAASAQLGGNGGSVTAVDCAADELLVGWDFVRESHLFTDYVRRITPVCAQASLDFDGFYRPGDERDLDTVGGGAFGTDFSHSCAPNRFAVGVSGTVVNDIVASLRLYCAEVRVLPGGIGRVDVTRSNLNGNTSGTESAPLFCPPGTIASGVRLRTGAAMDAISLRCRTLTIEAQ